MKKIVNKNEKKKTHPSLNFLRRATALFLIIFFTSRPPELSPSLGDPVVVAAPDDVSSSFSSSLPVAALHKRLLMFVKTLFIFAVVEPMVETAPLQTVAPEPTTPPLEYIFSLETLRKSFPKSLPPSSRSDELVLVLRSGEMAATVTSSAADLLSASQLVADFRKLLTDACVDFFNRDLSSAFKSIGR